VRRRAAAAPAGPVVLTVLGVAFALACTASSPAPVSSPAGSSAGPSAGSSGGATGGRWAPAVGTAWQWQLSVPVDPRADVPVYDIDGFTNGAAVVRRLHGLGRKVICYVDTGAAESYRPDYRRFAPRVLGRANGWPGERWLDIRRLDVLRPIMAARFDMCRSKGFDAVEPDLVENYTEATGFPLTATDQLAYNRLIARLVHERGMSVGLKNDIDQVAALWQDFDFAINEECAQFHECATLTRFIKAGKAVLHVEYRLPADEFCATTKALGFSSMRKRLALDAWRRPC
jgi:hypothetical protein